MMKKILTAVLMLAILGGTVVISSVASRSAMACNDPSGC
jgi:hypothetical protein